MLEGEREVRCERGHSRWEVRPQLRKGGGGGCLIESRPARGRSSITMGMVLRTEGKLGKVLTRMERKSSVIKESAKSENIKSTDLRPNEIENNF